MKSLLLKPALLVAGCLLSISFAQAQQYVRTVTINNTNTSTLSNHQVRIVVNTQALIAAGKMQASGADIQFRQCNTILSYWIENQTINTAQTAIWVKVPNLAVGNNPIELLYGNPTATASTSGTATFEMFDDFDNLTNWSSCYGDWSTTNTPPAGAGAGSFATTTTNGCASGSNSNQIPALLNNSYTITNGIIESRFYGTSPYNCTNIGTGVLARGSSCTTSTYGYFAGSYAHGYSIDYQSSSVSTTSSVLASIGSSSSLDQGYYRYKVALNGSSLQFSATEGSLAPTSLSVTDATLSSGKLGLHTWQKPYFDWIFVRKYAANDPGFTLGNETAYTGGSLLPVVVTNSPTAQCAPATVDLTLPAVTAGSTAGLNYTYWLNAAATQPVSNATAVTNTGSKLYYIVGTNHCGSDTAEVMVTFYPKPIVSVSQPAPVCEPNIVDLSNTVNANIQVNYTFYNADYSPRSNSVSTVADSQKFYVIGTTSNGCSDTETVYVTINPKPVVVTHNPTAQCAPSTVNLTLPAVTAGSTAGLTYTYWLNAAATQLVSGATAVTNTGSKLYYLVGTTNKGCTDTTNVMVTFYNKPNVVAYNPPAACTGSSVNIKTAATTYGSTANLTYTYWNSANQNITATANAITVGGSYRIVGANSAGCKDTATVTVTFNNCGGIMSGNNGNQSNNEVEQNGLGKLQQILVKLYPNPASNVLYFEYEAYQSGTVASFITDATGRTVRQQQFQSNSAGVQKFDVDVQSLPAGMYYFHFQLPESKENKTIKFAINK